MDSDVLGQATSAAPFYADRTSLATLHNSSAAIVTGGDPCQSGRGACDRRHATHRRTMNRLGSVASANNRCHTGRRPHAPIGHR